MYKRGVTSRLGCCGSPKHNCPQKRSVQDLHHRGESCSFSSYVTFDLCGYSVILVNFLFVPPHSAMPSIMGLWEAPVSQQHPATEDQRGVQYFLNAYGLEYTPDGQYVRWSVSNKRHPRNWPTARKIYDTGLIIFLDFFTYVSRDRVGKNSF